LVVRALRCAWQYWQVKEKSIELSQRASLDDLATLLRLFVSDGAWLKVSEHLHSKQVSTVEVGQYLHGAQSNKCRDVRYKFDRGRDLEAVLNESIPDKDQRMVVQQVIRATGFGVAEIRGEEMAELVARLAHAGDLLPELIDITGRNSPIRGEKLKSLWLQDLK